MQTTVEDLAKWDANFAHPIVGGASFAERMELPGRLATGEKLDYAAGLRVTEYRGARRIGHGGSWAGFRAAMARFPEHRFSVITLCNLSTAEPSELARRVVDLWIGDKLKPETKSAALPAPKAPKAPPAEDLGRYSGLYWNRESDVVRKIVRREGKLFYQRSEENESRLVPLGGGRFRLDGSTAGVEARFEPGGMRVFVEGEAPTLYEPVAPVALPGPELASYEGRYRSEVLNVSYEIAWASDRLLLRRPGHPEAPLEPLFGDAFRDSDVGLLHFSRDAAGRCADLRSGPER